LRMDQDSDALQYGFSLGVGLGAQRSHRQEREMRFDRTSTSDSRRESIRPDWSVGVGARVYPWTHPFGLQLTANGNGYYNHEWSSQYAAYSNDFLTVDRRETDRIVEETYRRTQVTGRAVMGYGRVRDATTVYYVHVLEDRLLATGAITERLSDSASQELAQVFYLRPDYASIHERSDRYFWSDVERVLREAGLLRDGVLGAYDVFRASEGFGPPGLDPTRWRGWFVGPVIEGKHRSEKRELDDYLQERDFVGDSLVARRTRQREETSSYPFDAFRVGGSIEYHQPLGWNWQIDFASLVTAPVRPDEHGVSASTEFQVRWLVADRWRADVNFDHSREMFEARGSDEYTPDSWEVHSGAGIAYFLEDRTELSVRLTQTQRRQEYYESSKQYQRDTRLSLGLEYHFLGRLDGPGLIDPLRLSQ